jgi:hypothetical protein
VGAQEDVTSYTHHTNAQMEYIRAKLRIFESSSKTSKKDNKYVHQRNLKLPLSLHHMQLTFHYLLKLKNFETYKNSKEST